MSRNMARVIVVFPAVTKKFSRREFISEEFAREFASELPGSYLVIDNRCSQEGGEMQAERKKIIVVFPAETGETESRGFFSPKLAELFSLRHPGAQLIIGSSQEQAGGQNGGI